MQKGRNQANTYQCDREVRKKPCKVPELVPDVTTHRKNGGIPTYGGSPLSSTDRVSGDFRKPFFIPKSEIQTSIPIPPVTGENRTQPDTSQSKNLHRVEESSHQQASQHPKTSSHWRKLDATKHLTVQIPPVTGTNDPLRCLPESVLFQRMEESPR